jgi:DNA-binding NtrC family response regulator
MAQLVESLLKKLGYPSVRVSDEAMELFMAYDWPGNVRELQNILEQTLLLSPFLVILPEHLPERLHLKKDPNLPLLPPLEEAERMQIIRALQTTSWNQSRAAHLLGIDRKTLRTKIQRYGLLKGELQ